MPSLINFGLIANPANWLIVFLMLAFAGVLVTILSQPLDFGHSAKASNSSSSSADDDE